MIDARVTCDCCDRDISFTANDVGYRLIDWLPMSEMPNPIPTDRSFLGTNGFFIDLIDYYPRKPDDDREGPGWMAYHGDVTPTHFAHVQRLTAAQMREHP